MIKRFVLLGCPILVTEAFRCEAMAQGSPVVEPILTADSTVLVILKNLENNTGTWLPEFRCVGNGLDVYQSFATEGPGIRDYSRKWVYSQSRRRALYCGGNHGAPHRFNDVWEFDLPSNTWVMLHKPDQGIEPNHAWWGITYDQRAEKLLWMNSAGWVWDKYGYEGPPFRFYEPYAHSSWDMLRAPSPYPGPETIQGGALEYIQGRDITVWYESEWNGAGMWIYSTNTNAWSQFLTVGDVYGNPNAPPAEAVMNYDRANDVLAAIHDQSVYVYRFDQNAWQKVATGSFSGANDAGSAFAYAPHHDIHLLYTGGNLFAYHYASNEIEPIHPTGDVPSDPGMAYFDEALNVFVFYFNDGNTNTSKRNWVYRYKKGISSSVADRTDENLLPQKFSFNPQPARSVGEFALSLTESGGTQPVTLRIYNLVGQEVARLIDNAFLAGTQRIPWDTSALPAGIYMATLQVGSRRSVQKVVVVH